MKNELSERIPRIVFGEGLAWDAESVRSHVVKYRLALERKIGCFRAKRRNPRLAPSAHMF